MTVIRPLDPGTDLIAGVAVDGVELANVVAFDSEEGWAECIVMRDGHPIINGLGCVTERVHGVVEITLRPL